MVMTILEGRVTPEQATALQAAYEKGIEQLPPQMHETFLARSADDAAVYRGIGIWKSREALDEYRRSVETPGGVPLFRSVGVEPGLSIYEIVAHGRP